MNLKNKSFLTPNAAKMNQSLEVNQKVVNIRNGYIFIIWWIAGKIIIIC